MSGFEEKLAFELFKPSTGFINALLAPKIEKVKAWSEEKEIKGKLDPNALSAVFENYLTKLAYRVAEITSISFPLQKLNISEAYEPLFLELLHQQHTSPFSAEDIINTDKNAILIIDNAGMGKSTFSKYFVTKALFKSDRFPILFELRKCNSDLPFIDNLAMELDTPGNIFPRKLFYELIKLGKFIIILDGFDEVPIDFQEDLSNQIYDLSAKGGENKLLLTSRPQESIPSLIDNLSFKFNQFTSNQSKSLLNRYDSISLLDVGSRLIDQIDKVPAKFLETPLLVSLLYRTFGTNNSIADRMCTFYDEIYHALYKGHDLINKNGYCREKKSGLDFEEFRRLLRALCYYMSITRKSYFKSWSEAITYIDKASELASIRPSSSGNFLDDLLIAVPLMQKDGCEYKFLHKTILEFFSAEYIIYKKNSFELAKKIFESKIIKSFDKVFDFIFDISPTLFNSVVTAKFASEITQLVNIDWTVVSTLVFEKECKVGLWEIEKYSKTLNERRFFSGTEDHDEGYLSAGYLEVVINNKEYFLVISHKDKPANLHKQAWLQLTKPSNILLGVDTSVEEDEYSDMLKLLGQNSWNPLTYEVGKSLSVHNSFLRLAQGSLLSSRFGREDEERIICKTKAEGVLNQINREQSIDLEFDEFLQ